MAKGKTTAAPSVDRVNTADERKWRAEDALRTLTRAQEVQKDSRLMSDVKRLAAVNAKQMQQIAKKK